MIRRSWSLGALALLSVACSSPEPELVVNVFAASSLTDVFADVEEAFEEQYLEFDVQLNVAGSSALREQIRSGAPADVFAFASQDIALELEDEGLILVEDIFATNALTVALAPGNPASISSLSDLERDELLIGVCAAGLPCGDLASQTLEAAGVAANVDTEEPDVRSLLSKVDAGELDAGIVYQTDVLASDAALEVIDFGLSEPLVTSYPIGVVEDATNSEGAATFVEFVLSDEGRNILAEAGFGLPE